MPGGRKRPGSGTGYWTPGSAEYLDIYKGNNSEPFESSEEVTQYMSNLVRTLFIEDFEPFTSGLSKDSVKVILPVEMDKIWFITYEACDDDTRIVTPVTQDSYDRIKKNPFRQANHKRVLRLLNDNNQIELIGKDIKNYKIRYIKRPEPIILDNLTDGLKIGNKSDKTIKLEAPESLHLKILMRAVQMAKAVWAS